MGSYISGARLSTDNTSDHKEDLRDGLDWLSPTKDGIAFLKRIGLKGFTFNNTQFFWTEDELAPRRQTATVADGVTTTITVPDANHVALDTILRWENEQVRVTARPSATTLTVVRGWNGTTAVAHSAKPLVRLGTARPENSDPNDGVSSNATKLSNYQQLFERDVELSNDEYDQLSTGGNPLTHNMKMRMIELMQELSASVWYGKAGANVVSGKTVYQMGGINSFLQTNVLNASAGALTIAMIDSQIKAVVDAGGDPNLIVLNTYQKQKLDALDNNKQFLGKREHTGGGLVTQTWQSGVLGHTIDIEIDMTLNDDEIYILDTSKIEVGYKMGRTGHRGFKQEDVTPVGRDGVKFAIRGKYSLRVAFEKGLAKIYNLA